MVDDEALMTALRAEQLSGCVYDLEDPAHRPFDTAMWDVSQSHPPARTRRPTIPEKFMENVLDIFFENLQRRLDDRPLSNAVDPRLGY